MKLSELNISITTVEYTHFKDNLIEYKRLCCNKHCQYKFDEKWREPFFTTYKFSNDDKNKFFYCYPYEYNDDWEKYNEISLLKNCDFYSYINMEDIINAEFLKHLK